jgi:spermidine synthase
MDAARSQINSNSVGWQCVVDLHDCETPHLDEIGWVRETMLMAASLAEATVVGEHFHRFRPHGVSGVVIIGESHLAVHVWPERKYAAVDVFTCNTALKMRAASEYLVEAFRAARPHTTCLARGGNRLEIVDLDTLASEGVAAAESVQPVAIEYDAPCDDLYIDEDNDAGGHWFVRHRTVASLQTAFQKAEIVELAEFGKALILDDEVQSVEADEYIYHEALVHPAMTLHACPRSVLIIGGGEGAVAREVLKHPDVERVVMVDIDAGVVALAREHLASWHMGAFDDPRLELVIGDGGEFVRNSRDMFDVIFIDVVSSIDSGPARALYENAFFVAARQRLASGGTVVIQGTGCHIRDYGSHRRIRTGVDGLYKNVRSYLTFIPSFLWTWGFVMASDVCDPRLASAEMIDRTLDDRDLSRQLRFYDGRTHAGLFELPKNIRQLLGETLYAPA